MQFNHKFVEMKGFWKNIIGGMLSVAAAATLGILCSEAASGNESWGTGLFSVKRHDFGRVALGADAKFLFAFENGFVEDIRIVDAQSSCGCTSVSIPNQVIKSKEQGVIVAKLNTTGQHLREKSATLTVHLEATVGGRILRDTVQLFVTGYIRPDVVLTPGIVEFGSVPEGQTVVRTLQLEYSGRPDWALTKIERGNPHVHAKAEEIKRQRNEVVYRITVTLRGGAPVGYVKDALRFTTNERSVGVSKPSEIVLPIQGVVMAPIHAKPSPFLAGLVSPGERVTKSIVVRSERPFRILGVESPDKGYQFTFAKQESNIQIISVLFSCKADSGKPGNLSAKIRIRTNLPDQEYVVLDALARIVPQTTAPEAIDGKEVSGNDFGDDLDREHRIALRSAGGNPAPSTFADLRPERGRIEETEIDEKTIDTMDSPPLKTARFHSGKAKFGAPKTTNPANREGALPR